ncbi:MAG: ABC transporter substrate-binding protein [Cyanobacteriota bacterium]|nr:ABC transporter substrate-binding protein [Cyanobacteriota bacterium]
MPPIPFCLARTLRGGVVVTTLLTLVAACSPPARRVSSPPLLGAAVALTGNASAIGQDQRIGLDLAAATIGPAGPGRRLPISLAVEDAGTDEQSASQAFRTLIGRDALAIIGPSLSQQAFAADPVADRAGVPVIGPSNTARGIPEIGPFVLRVSAPVSQVAPLSIARALRNDPGLQRVAVFYAQDDAYSTSETAIFQKALTDRRLKPVSVQRHQFSDTDFQTQVTAVLPLNPQLVVISAGPVDGGNLVRQLRTLGYRGQIVAGNAMNSPNIFPICQQQCDGLLIAQAYSPALAGEANRRFVAAYRQKLGNDTPPQFTAQAYTAAQVAAEALRRLDARRPVRGRPLAEVRRELNSEILAGRYDTPLGPLRFTPDGEVIQERFGVARVRMEADGRRGRFELLD